MTITIEKVTTHPVNSVYAPSRGGNLVTQEWIRCHSDQTATRESIDMDDIHTAIADTDFTEKVSDGVYILKRWILIERNVELNLRNTTLLIKSVGNDNQGAGFQLKTFGSTKNEVLTGNSRSQLLTGNTRIDGENKTTDRGGVGPFMRNGDWRNEGGDTRVTYHSGFRHDFSAGWVSLPQNGLDGQVEGHRSVWDFEQPWAVSIMRLGTGPVTVHCFIHGTSNPAGLEILTAGSGGDFPGPGQPQNNFSGGRYLGGRFSGALTGPHDTVRAGRAKKSHDLTNEFIDVQLSSHQVVIERRYAFFDVCGVSGSHTDKQIGISQASLTGHQSGMDGLFRLSHRWGPTFRAPDGATVGVGLLDVILGTVSGGAADSLHNTGDNLGATINSDGTISWTDPFTQSLDSDTARDHVRLPRLWTRNADASANNQTVYSCNTATWQMFAAGFSPSILPQQLAYPFAGKDFGNFEDDIIIAVDSVFGNTSADVAAVRTLLDDSLFADGSGKSQQIYQLFCWLAEQETTALAGRSLISTLGLAYAGVKVSFIVALNFNVTTLTNGVEYTNADGAQVKVPAVAGQAYEASEINFGTAIPDCTVDAPTITGTVDASNPIDGLILEQATAIDLSLDADQTITVDDIRGDTLTISNTGTATDIGVLTNTPDNVSAGTGVTLLTQVRVTGMVDGGMAALYQLTGGVPSIVAAQEVANAGTTHTWTGLVLNSDYRLVWSKSGYDPIVMDVDMVAVGRREIELSPQKTNNSSGDSVPTGVTIAVTYTTSLISFEIDTVRVVDGATVNTITGEETNALFESAKDQIQFVKALAQHNEVDIIRHTGLSRTSLLQNLHQLTGEATSRCRHRIQAVDVHDSTGAIDTTLEANVRSANVTIGADTVSLPEVINIPGAAAATYGDVADLIDDAVAEIDLLTGSHSQQVVVDGYTPDGENAAIGHVIAGGG